MITNAKIASVEAIKIFLPCISQIDFYFSIIFELHINSVVAEQNTLIEYLAVKNWVSFSSE